MKTATLQMLKQGRSLLCRGVQVVTKPFVEIDFPHLESPLHQTQPYLSAEATNQWISAGLQTSQPFMVGRLGTSELAVVKQYQKIQQLSVLEKLADFGVTGEWNFGWNRRSGKSLERNAGFFPLNHANLNRYSVLVIESMLQVDLLASWVEGEGYFRDRFLQAQLCQLRDIEPYYHVNPWSQYLAGKRVLVIHPFADSIQKQYQLHRRQLFPDRLVLPEFELITLAAVQSMAGNRPASYPNWFAALAGMYEQALQANPDVIILGCGAYGFPLAAMLKAASKQVIHLGGATQILFGIKGQRWDNRAVSAFFNDAWTRPAAAERPPGAEQVEDACYW